MKCEYKDGVLEIFEIRGDESGWMITYDANNVFRLYEFPLYGGEPQYLDTYTNFHIAIEDARKLT